MNCDFTIDHWCEIIHKALDMGYHFYSFADYVTSLPVVERSIILRHDIDVSLVTAVRLARIETKMCINATYFVRLHSKLYQLPASESLTNLYELSKTNSEIGLHYERQYYNTIGGNHKEMLAEDARLLRNMLGRPIIGCAGHRVGNFHPFDTAVVKEAGFVYEAYAREFVEERKYISDSARQWREGCLCQWLGKINHLTVLMHPIWYFEPTESRDRILASIRRGD
jgi:hypothetical protein